MHAHEDFQQCLKSIIDAVCGGIIYAKILPPPINRMLLIHQTAREEVRDIESEREKKIEERKSLQEKYL